MVGQTLGIVGRQVVDTRFIAALSTVGLTGKPNRPSTRALSSSYPPRRCVDGDEQNPQRCFLCKEIGCFNAGPVNVPLALGLVSVQRIVLLGCTVPHVRVSPLGRRFRRRRFLKGRQWLTVWIKFDQSFLDARNSSAMLMSSSMSASTARCATPPFAPQVVKAQAATAAEVERFIRSSMDVSKSTSISTVHRDRHGPRVICTTMYFSRSFTSSTDGRPGSTDSTDSRRRCSMLRFRFQDHPKPCRGAQSSSGQGAVGCGDPPPTSGWIDGVQGITHELGWGRPRRLQQRGGRPFPQSKR